MARIHYLLITQRNYNAVPYVLFVLVRLADD